MKNTKVFATVEVILACAATIALCGIAMYVNEHPIRAFFEGISVSHTVPIVLACFAVGTIINLIVATISGAIKTRKEKKN